MAPGERPRDDAQGAGDGRDARRPRDRPGARGLRAPSRPRRSSPRRSRRSSSTSCSPASTPPTASAGVVPAGRRGPDRAAVPVLRREDRARHGRRDRPRPAHQRRPATTSSRRRCRRSIIVHAGARRAALPVAQGDHGRALEGDRDAVAGRPRARRLRRSAAAVRDDEGRRRRAPPAARPRRGSSARPADEAARQVVDFLAERRLI